MINKINKERRRSMNATPIWPSNKKANIDHKRKIINGEHILCSLLPKLTLQKHYYRSTKCQMVIHQLHLFSILDDRSARHCCCVYMLFHLFWPFSTWSVPVFQLEYCKITLMICCLLFRFIFWRLVRDMQASLPQIPFQNSIEWHYWRFHDNHRKNTSADVFKFKCLPFSC
jgi:hypothetical protein